MMTKEQRIEGLLGLIAENINKGKFEKAMYYEEKMLAIDLIAGALLSKDFLIRECGSALYKQYDDYLEANA